MNKEFYLSTGIIALIYASIAGLQYYSLTGSDCSLVESSPSVEDS